MITSTYDSVTVREMLNFFGKCEECGYPASASWVETVTSGRATRELIAECGLPCGWRGAAQKTPMTL